MHNYWADCNKVRVKVESIKGVCTAGCKVGDEWMLQKYTPEGFCGITYCLLYPSVRTLVFGGTVPFAREGKLRVACPDPKNTVVFTLETVKKGEPGYA